ncbi:YadA-like family protein [Fusobacterium animalis]|uniref:YadA-like family protein n=1 Tax=Fusobacterium animalis TaxID=76859 RepID=UPI001C6E3541|nr:YadA-like family protein [Fusobacterium animalis]QYR68489.1 YadA-like family protein [Fusobacterium animalis]
MKKSVSLKLIVFSFLLVGASVSYSAAPEFQAGSGSNSTEAGVGNEASEKNSSAFGYRNEASEISSSAFGANNKASEINSSAFGANNKASEISSSAFGANNKASGGGSSAFGADNKASGNRSSAFGADNKASGKYSSAFGYQNTASGENSSVVGSQYKVTGEASGAFGVGENSGWNAGANEYNYDYINEGKNSYMFGNYNKIAAGTENNFILGNNVSIGNGINNSVALGNNSTVSSSNEVSVGSATLKRKITNVADGDVSATSTDVVTGKQLYNGDGINTAAWKAKLGVGDLITSYTKKDGSNLTASDISTWKTKLGVGAGGSGMANSATGTGSTGLGTDNTVTGDYSTTVGYKNKVTGNHSGAFGDPNVVTGNGSYAFGNDNNIAGDNNFVLGNNVNIGSGIQNSVALGNNSTVSSSNEVSVGSATQQRKITNVADGDISATSTDAVTGRQLYKVMQNSGTTGIENLRNEVNEKIDDVKNEVNHVGSLSATLAGLHPMQYDPKAPTQVMAALGNYRNKQSVAVGLSYYFNDRFMMSAGVAIGSEKRVKSMANVGFTVKLGKGSGVTYNEVPQYAIQDEVKRLTVENNKQAKENQELKERVKKLEEKLNILLKNK